MAALQSDRCQRTDCIKFLVFLLLQINAGAMFPIIATQFGVNRYIEKFLEGKRDTPLSNQEKVGMAMVAGSSSAVIGCPAEYLMIHQQKTGLSLSQVLSHTKNTLGALSVYRGLVCRSSCVYALVDS